MPLSVVVLNYRYTAPALSGFIASQGSLALLPLLGSSSGRLVSLWKKQTNRKTTCLPITLGFCGDCSEFLECGALRQSCNALHGGGASVAPLRTELGCDAPAAFQLRKLHFELPGIEAGAFSGWCAAVHSSASSRSLAFGVESLLPQMGSPLRGSRNSLSGRWFST